MDGREGKNEFFFKLPGSDRPKNKRERREKTKQRNKTTHPRI